MQIVQRHAPRSKCFEDLKNTFHAIRAKDVRTAYCTFKITGIRSHSRPMTVTALAFRPSAHLLEETQHSSALTFPKFAHGPGVTSA